MSNVAQAWARTGSCRVSPKQARAVVQSVPVSTDKIREATYMSVGRTDGQDALTLLAVMTRDMNDQPTSQAPTNAMLTWHLPNIRITAAITKDGKPIKWRNLTGAHHRDLLRGVRSETACLIRRGHSRQCFKILQVHDSLQSSFDSPVTTLLASFKAPLRVKSI